MNHRGAALSHYEPHNDFCAFCESVWAAPGVEAACLELQDGHGADVSLVLLALYLSAQGRTADDAVTRRARAAATDWTPHVTAHLRAARRALKGRDSALYRAALALELDAERALLARLAAIAADAPAAEPGDALTAANLIALAGAAAAETETARRLARSAHAAGAVESNGGPGARMVSELEEAEALRRLHELRAQHRALDQEVNALATGPVTDQLRLMRLKRQKLALKDEIARLEDELRPDIIA